MRCSDLVCGKGQRSLLRSFCKNTCPGFITEWIQNIVSVEIDFDRTLQRDWRTECISISSEPIILSLDQPSRDLIPTPTAYMYTDHIILSFNFYPYTYGSVSAGREKWPFNVIFFRSARTSCRTFYFSVRPSTHPVPQQFFLSS